MDNFKQWLTESINFSTPESLDNFLDYAIINCIKTHHKLPPDSNIKKAIIELISTLEDIQKKVKKHVAIQPLVNDKFKAISPYLNKNEYPHRFPTFASVIKVISTLGSNYLLDKQDSLAISSVLQKIHVLQSQKTVVR